MHASRLLELMMCQRCRFGVEKQATPVFTDVDGFNDVRMFSSSAKAVSKDGLSKYLK
jgi:hypothetical protein